MLGTFIPDLFISGLTNDGRAFGIYKEITVIVEKGIPGDLADVSMIKSPHDKTLAIAKVISIKKHSPLRVATFCKHFKYCGGCQWQNIGIKDQLKLKQQQLEALFSYTPSPFQLMPIIASPEQIRFRNRVTFTFSNRRWMSPEELMDPQTLKRPAAGFVMKGNNDRVMNIEECFLADEFATRLMHYLRDEVLRMGYSFYDVRHETGFLRTLTVRFDDNNGIMAIVVFGEDDKAKIEAVMNYLKNTFPQITSLFFVIHKRKRGTIGNKSHILFSGKPIITYKMEDLTFHIGPNSFFQTNSAQAIELYKIARNLADLKGHETVYDLYTGTGTIAMFVARSANKVIGIDHVPEAIEDAKKNAILNHIPNTIFLSGDLKDVFNDDTFNRHGRADVVITDPPRAGMNLPVIRNLIRSKAKRIVYISCNPNTQIRDIRNLNNHYQLIQVQPVDMFPQTNHVENVVLLERIGE